MNTSSAARKINATSRYFRKGYSAIDSYYGIRTCYCDVLPTIRRTRSGKFCINDSTGNAGREIYATLREAVEAAIAWFTTCCQDAENAQNCHTPGSAKVESNRFYRAVALGNVKALEKFRGF